MRHFFGIIIASYALLSPVFAADQAVVDAKRKAKAEGNFFVEAEHKIGFLIRIKG